MKTVRLSKWAKDHGYSYQGAYEMYARGQLDGSRKLPSGSIVVDIPEEVKPKQEKTVIYVRVSTPKQKDDLERQAERMIQFCTNAGYVVHKVVKEVASGLNDSRPKLNTILDDPTISRLVVENKDRLTRFGFRYLENCLQKNSCELVVVNRSDDGKEDLIQDFVSIITSMTARIYGNRRMKNKRDKFLEIIDESDDPI